MRTLWTLREHDLLARNYFTAKAEELKRLLPARTYNAIKLRAQRLGLVRGQPDQRMADLSPLLRHEPLSYYWIGFLLADAHVSESKIKLKLAKKDQEHVSKFADFVMYRGDRKDMTELSSMDKKVVEKIRQRFGITNQKTYEPPSIAYIEDRDLLLATIIGYIDGDGCIGFQHGRTDCAIRIKCHASWLSNLQFISNFVAGETGVPPNKAGINKKGYALLTMSHWKITKFLKRQTCRLDLPVLKRKWDRINLERVGKTEQAEINRTNVVSLWMQGTRQVDICRITRLSKATVSIILKTYKESNNEQSRRSSELANSF